MPVTHFLAMMLTVFVAAALSLTLMFWAEAPIAAVMVLGLFGSLLMGARQWR